jgi:tRNA A-37 threonylcarbamoyl transferase component Bud32
VPQLDASLTRLCGACGYRLEATLLRCPVDGSRLPRERADAAVLGSYRLLERLGTGGMGVVYRAVHQKLGRTVAIKVLNRALLADRTNVARFFQEARAVNTIRHPNVVDIYDFVAAGKDIYTVMELLVGCDLHHALYRAGAPFAAERAVGLLLQICAGLQAAHDRSIIHRDLKPANVFLTTRDGAEFVKLLDFGLAKLERAEGRMTRDGVVLGTPEYMAPEQARGAALDCRADIYGIGCLAFHMLTGSQLFAGGSYADVMVRHVKERPPAPRALNAALPDALERAILRALAKDPGGRPPSARALAEELCAAIGRPLDSFPVVPARPRSAGAVPLAESAEDGGYAMVLPRSLWQGPGRRPLAVAVTAAALALMGAGVWRRTHLERPLAAAAPVPLAPARVEPRPAPAVPPQAVLAVPIPGPTAPPRHRARAARRAVPTTAPEAEAGYPDSRARTINPFER